MKQFDTFSEYMFDLLFAPLKKGRKTANQLRIFFKVMGREFDDLKAAIFRVRNEANVASCSEVMLPVHGQDRDMPRLEGEDAEAYRTRLSMKGIISQWSGTRRGVLYALTALGYDRSRIELFAEQDAERWAEFIIFLNSSKPSGVTNPSVCGRISSVKDISWPRRSWRKAAHRAAAIPSREPAHLQPPRSSITSARTPFIRASPRTLRRARRRRRVQRST